jgi:hypothetical protein
MFLYTNIAREKTAEYLLSTKSPILQGLWFGRGGLCLNRLSIQQNKGDSAILFAAV